MLRRELDREEVKLAVVYGGFTSSNYSRDIEVAIFTGYSVSLEKEMEYCEELSRIFAEKVGYTWTSGSSTTRPLGLGRRPSRSAKS